MPLSKKQLVRLVRLVAQLKENRYPNCASANKKILEYLYPKNGKTVAIILNKSDIVDDISNLPLQAQAITPDVKVLPRIFTTSAKLELQRCNSKEDRKQSFAYTESRTQVMTICDLAFSDLRTWLYENVLPVSETKFWQFVESAVTSGLSFKYPHF